MIRHLALAAILFAVPQIAPAQDVVGGTVNTVLKKPQADAAYSMQFTGGSYAYYRAEGDATGSMNASGTARYRFATAYQSNESVRDGSELQGTAFAT